MVNLVKPEHEAKANSSIVITPSGIIKLPAKPEQPEKADLPIVVIP